MLQEASSSSKWSQWLTPVWIWLIQLAATVLVAQISNSLHFMVSLNKDLLS